MGDQTSVQHAANLMLNPQPEQVEQEVVAEEILEEETQEVIDEVQEEEVSEEELEVGDSEDSLDSDEEMEETSEEEPEAKDEGGEYHSVKVDGEGYEVTLEELKKGYQLEQNYTKNKQALVEKEKEVDSIKASLTEERNKYIQFNEMQMSANNQALLQAQAKLETIDRTEDPLGYVMQQTEVQEVAKGIESSRQAWEAAQTQQQMENNQRMQTYLAEQAVVLQEALPEWGTDSALRESVASFAKAQGYTEEALGQVSAKDVLILNKARMFDELQTKKSVVRDKRTKPKTKPVVRSKSAKSASAVKANITKQKRANFKQTGKVGDAASLIADMLNKT